jgi:hypothetical protein
MGRATVLLLAVAGLACSHTAPARSLDSRRPGARSSLDCPNQTITYHHDGGSLESQGVTSVDRRGNPIASSIGCEPQPDKTTNAKGK